MGRDWLAAWSAVYWAAWATILVGLFLDVPVWLWALGSLSVVAAGLLRWGRSEDAHRDGRSTIDGRSAIDGRSTINGRSAIDGRSMPDREDTP